MTAKTTQQDHRTTPATIVNRIKRRKLSVASHLHRAPTAMCRKSKLFNRPKYAQTHLASTKNCSTITATSQSSVTSRPISCRSWISIWMSFMLKWRFKRTTIILTETTIANWTDVATTRWDPLTTTWIIISLMKCAIRRSPPTIIVSSANFRSRCRRKWANTFAKKTSRKITKALTSLRMTSWKLVRNRLRQIIIAFSNRTFHRETQNPSLKSSKKNSSIMKAKSRSTAMLIWSKQRKFRTWNRIPLTMIKFLVSWNTFKWSQSWH